VFLCTVGFYTERSLYWIIVFLHGGPTHWLTMQADDARFPQPIKWALSGQPPAASAGAFTWHEADSGLETAELPVMANGQQVDSILLVRVNPAQFRFVVQNAPAGQHDLHGWMNALHPVVLINGSYFSWNGKPDTPFLSNGSLLSSRDKPPAQGAFVVSNNQAVAVDALPDSDWRRAFQGVTDGLATYPLLIGPDGYNRAIKESHWVANRSFVGEDGKGDIIFGTTTSAFFSLSRFAPFLYSAPLDLKVALNLDGGPVACQAVNTSGYQRHFCGAWEIRDYGGLFKVLHMPAGSWIPLPVVVAVYKK
jgi:hypothetical protein